MSGRSFGCFSYLDVPEILRKTGWLSDFEADLVNLGYFDIAFRVKRLIALCTVAEKQIYETFEPLKPVFYSIEKYDSNDINKRELIDVLDQFRKDVLR